LLNRKERKLLLQARDLIVREINEHGVVRVRGFATFQTRDMVVLPGRKPQEETPDGFSSHPPPERGYERISVLRAQFGPAMKSLVRNPYSPCMYRSPGNLKYLRTCTQDPGHEGPHTPPFGYPGAEPPLWENIPAGERWDVEPGMTVRVRPPKSIHEDLVAAKKKSKKKFKKSRRYISDSRRELAGKTGVVMCPLPYSDEAIWWVQIKKGDAYMLWANELQHVEFPAVDNDFGAIEL